MKNYYQTLGVPDTASNEEIRSAYRRLLQESLMDKERFDAVKEAFEALRTPEKRAEYDLALSESKHNGSNPNRLGTIPLLPPADKRQPGQVCSSCGYENPKYEHYCRKCGFLLTIPGDINSKTPAGILKNPRLIDELGHVYSVKPGVNTIGRENSDIVLPDKTVSRQHAHIVYDEDRDIYSIEDLGSTNGTFLNSLRLSQNSPNPVLPGDDLQFGSFAVRVVSGSSPSDAAISIAPSHASEHLTAQTHTLSPQTKTDALVVGQLKLLQGGGPSEVPITLGANTLGRMADNVICIRADRYVSGHHAVLNADEQVFRLTDLGSTNGTFLNGLRLTPNEAVAISDGDEITLGGAVFIFRRGPINVE